MQKTEGHLPVLRLCARHRTLSEGRCPQCLADRHERRRVHVSAAGKKFRAAILERDGYVCTCCGEAASVDYLLAIVLGGQPLDPENATAACRDMQLSKRRGDHELRGELLGRGRSSS